MRLPFWATTLTLLGLIILCGLGTWQLQRLQWKETLLAQLENAYANGSEEALTPASLQNRDIAMGTINGTFLFDKLILIGPKPYKEQIGYHAYVPVKTPEATYLVDMGWAKEGSRYDPATLAQRNGKNIRISGLAYKPSWSGFTPANEPENDLWFKADINEIARVKGLENPAPFIIRAFSSNYKFDAAFPNNERYYPNNNHLQYACFWFAVAGALLVVFVLRFAIKRPA